MISRKSFLLVAKIIIANIPGISKNENGRNLARVYSVPPIFSVNLNKEILDFFPPYLDMYTLKMD